jgi:dihydrofolate reductase
MRKLSVFNSVSVDGYFSDAKGDMTWAHRDDPEMGAFAAENAGGDGALVFGRVTYDLMVQFWPTAEAKAAMPEVAEGMNRMPKLVFSRTLQEASWAHTELVRDDPADVMQARKREAGPDMVILGSGTIVSQLTEARLIDEYQLAVIPVVLGGGRTLFEGVSGNPDLQLVSTRTFESGTVLLTYRPAA